MSVIIAAFNEETAIHGVLAELRQGYPEAEILVVDDGSSDATAEQIRRVPGVRLLSHPTNRGYGAALKTAMRHCTRPVVVWFDGDGQHRIEDLARIAGPVVRGELDANFGAREPGSAYVMSRAPGKWLLRMVAQMVARRRIPDLNCGFRAFRLRVIRRYLHLLPNGFSASATSTLLMLKRGYRVCFTPIRSQPRTGTSTVRVLRDGFLAIALILRIMLMFDSLLFFTGLALLQVVAASVYSVWIIIKVGFGMPVLGAVVLLSGCLTFFIGLLSAQISEIRKELFEMRSSDEGE